VKHIFGVQKVVIYHHEPHRHKYKTLKKKKKEESQQWLIACKLTFFKRKHWFAHLYVSMTFIELYISKGETWHTFSNLRIARGGSRDSVDGGGGLRYGAIFTLSLFSMVCLSFYFFLIYCIYFDRSLLNLIF
jgi:hypothetical protein